MLSVCEGGACTYLKHIPFYVHVMVVDADALAAGGYPHGPFKPVTIFEGVPLRCLSMLKTT